MSAVHRVVMATVRKSLATARLRAEELRSQRDSMATISKGQQSAAIALGKRLREADRIAESWSLVQVAILAATLSGEDRPCAVCAGDDDADDDRPCAGFPDSCPTIYDVPADMPTHAGGVRCGCAGSRVLLTLSDDPGE